MRAGARSCLFVTVAIPNVSDNVNAVDETTWAAEGGPGGIKYPLVASGAEIAATCPATELAVALPWPTASKLAHAAVGNVSLAVDLRLVFLGGGSGEIRQVKAAMTKIPNKIRQINQKVCWMWDLCVRCLGIESEGDATRSRLELGKGLQGIGGGGLDGTDLLVL